MLSSLSAIRFSAPEAIFCSLCWLDCGLLTQYFTGRLIFWSNLRTEHADERLTGVSFDPIIRQVAHSTGRNIGRLKRNVVSLLAAEAGVSRGLPEKSKSQYVKLMTSNLGMRGVWGGSGNKSLDETRTGRFHQHNANWTCPCNSWLDSMNCLALRM